MNCVTPIKNEMAHAEPKLRVRVNRHKIVIWHKSIA